MTTWTSQRHGRADSVRRSSKRSFHDSLIGLVSGVRRTRSSPTARGSRPPGLRTCATLRSHISGSTTWMRVREVFSRRTTALPTCRKDWATEFGWEVASVDAVDLQHRRSHARAPRVCSCRGLWHETGRPWHYHGTQGAHCFAIHCCPGTQGGPGRVRGLLHCSGSPERCCAGGITNVN